MIARKMFFLHLLLISMMFSGSYSVHAANWGSIFVDYPFPNFISSTGSNSSIAIDSARKPHIIYQDGSDKLKYATNRSGQWKLTTFDSWGDVASVSSIAIDSSDKMHIIYNNIPNWDLKYATNISGSWTTTTVVSKGRVGSAHSIAIDTADRIHISYRDSTNGYFKYAFKENGSWTVKTLEDNGVAGTHSSIVTDPQNNVHISYIESHSILKNYTQVLYNQYIKYATNKSGKWVITTVYIPTLTEETNYHFPESDTSIAVDKTNSAHIALHQPQLKDLYYATNISGSWVVTKLIEIGDTGYYPSISVDSDNKTHISYHDRTNGVLKHISNSTGPWISETVDSRTSGIYSSMAMDSSNAVHISYAYSNNTSCFDCGGSHFIKYANNTIPPHQVGVGSWSYSTKGNWVSGNQNCLPDRDKTAQLTLTRDGNNVSVVLDDGLKIMGMLNNDELILSASFSEPPTPHRYELPSNVTYLANGLMTVFVDLIAASSTSVSGTLSWSWVFDENLTCYGGSSINITAINVSPPEIKGGVIEPTGGVIEQRHAGLPWLMLLLKNK